MVLITSGYSPTVKAASEAECSIWLCLPTGFPSGCGEAKSAFKKRIKKLKPPLPDFLACMIKQEEIPPQLKDSYKPSNMTYKESIHALMPDGSYIDGLPCIKISSNRHGLVWRPWGCKETHKSVDVYIDGIKTGETYYYNPNHIN